MFFAILIYFNNFNLISGGGHILTGTAAHEEFPPPFQGCAVYLPPTAWTVGLLGLHKMNVKPEAVVMTTASLELNGASPNPPKPQVNLHSESDRSCYVLHIENTTTWQYRYN